MVARDKRTSEQADQSVRAVFDYHTVETDKAEADALFLSIGEGALVTDSAGKIIRVNQIALDILNVRANAILGKWYPECVVAEDDHGNTIQYIDRPIAEMFMTGKPVFSKLYFIRSDGSRVPVALTVSPVLVEGRPVGAIEIFRDISDEVRLDKAKDEFISLASHQLRTPATGVKQYLGMLIEGYAGKLTEKQRQYLSIANEGNDRQLRIIDDILKVAAADSGNMVLNKERVDLIKLIKTVIDEQSSKFAENNQTIMFEYSTPNIHTNIDKNAYRMVLENLIDNAHKYSYHDKTINVRVVKSDQTVEISVSDEGTGIDKSDVGKLFQKFSRLSNPLSISSGGTGLGLYWVKQIVDLHGGTIAVKSDAGIGTTFTVTHHIDE